MENLENYLLVDKIKNKRGEDTTEFKECDGRLIIKQYAGVNTDNFVIKKMDGKKLSFSFFKINGIHYININGEHIIDYRKFTNIQQISKVEETIPKTSEDGQSETIKINSIKVKNGFIGDLMIHNCDPEMFQKALNIMSKYMKNKNSYYSDFIYFMFN
jgi:hypothetical protein